MNWDKGSWAAPNLTLRAQDGSADGQQVVLDHIESSSDVMPRKPGKYSPCVFRRLIWLKFVLKA